MKKTWQFLSFFLHDGSGSFPERTQFLGVGAQGIYSSDGFGDKKKNKKTNHFRFNHFDALRKPLNNQWSFIRYANTTIALLYLIQYYLQTKHRLLSSLSRPWFGQLHK